LDKNLLFIFGVSAAIAAVVVVVAAARERGRARRPVTEAG
jgi:uncharacterized membrane protein